MIYTKPNYYDEFNCIADRCPDTCCAGWQIVIDEESLEHYEVEQSEYKKVLAASIDWREGVFKQKHNKRCAFLNERNLCEMYLNLGEDSLCETCTRYPRHMEEFENVREYTLSVSCPEVARLLVQLKESVSFLYEEDDEEEEFEEYNPFLFSILEDGRELIRRILQNRKIDISVRAEMVWKLVDEMQSYLDEDEMFACQELFEQYEKQLMCKESVQDNVEGTNTEYWREKERKNNVMHNDAEKYYAFAQDAFRKLYSLERLSEDWEFYLLDVEKVLYQNGAEDYLKLKTDFQEWLIKQDERMQFQYSEQAEVQENDVFCMQRWTIIAEQLLVYFIYTYFCGAVYDYAPAAKARMSILSVHYIYELLLVKWLKKDKTLNVEDVIFIVYRYSRELEHSDENLDLMEEMMEDIV